MIMLKLTAFQVKAGILIAAFAAIAFYIIKCLVRAQPISIWKLFVIFAGAGSFVYGILAITAILFENLRPLLSDVAIYGLSGLALIVSGLRGFGVEFDYDKLLKHQKPEKQGDPEAA